MKFKKEKSWNNDAIVIKKIAITSVFLSLAMIFSGLSTVMPLPFLATFLNLNLSSIFIAIILLLINFYYAFFATIITSLLVFANPGTGQWIGVLVNFFSNFTFISILYLINQLLIKKTISKDKNNHSGLNYKLHYVSEMITVIFTSIILSGLNGLLFTPLFGWQFGIPIKISTPSFIEMMNNYNNGGIENHLWFFGIPDYWSGIFALYMAFNLFNFAICSLGITAAKTFIIKSGALTRISNKDLGGVLWKISNI